MAAGTERVAGTLRTQWLAFLLNALLGAICAFFLARCFFVAVTDGLLLPASCSIRCRYIGPQYYFSYGHGFIRRGLPGTVLALFGGPSTGSIDIMGWSLVLAGVAAVTALAVLVFLELRGTTLRYAAAALVLLCPLSASLVVLDPGRYDAIGIVGLVVIALAGALSSNSRRPVVVGSAATIVIVVAALSEELLALFMVAPILMLMRRHAAGLSRRKAAVACAAPIAVGLVVAAASSAFTPTQTQVDAAQIASGRAPGTYSAAIFMRASISRNFHYVAEWGPEAFIHAMLIWLSIFTLAALVLAVAYRVRGRWYWYAAAGNALGAVAISFIGLDQRRWWTLAFLSQVTALAVHYAGSRRSRAEPAPSDEAFSTWANGLFVAGLFVVAFVLMPQMFLVSPNHRARFLVASVPIPLVGAYGILGIARGWGKLRLIRSPSWILPLVAPLVLFLGTVFATASWYFVALDLWRQSRTWSDVASYWYAWF